MQERRYDLDWLRVFAIILLHFFHSAMPFVVEWGWHIKNPQVSNLLMECNFFLSRWRMPLLFFISGIGTTYVLAKATAGQYAWQRFKRLFVPLVFGILVIVPPQVYMERMLNGVAYGNILEFYPTIFTSGVYPQGNFSWHHLWFIAYLFVFSIVAIPLFLFLKSETGKTFSNKVAVFSAKVGMLWVVLPTFLASLLMFEYPVETHALVDDWATFFRYFSFFVSGYFIGTHIVFWDAFLQKRRLYLKTAFFSMLAINYLRWNNLEPEWQPSLQNVAYMALWTLSAWCWILALLGYAKRYMNFNNRFLKYANEGIYPFYILHQTVIVIIAFYVVQVDETIISKYLFLSLVSLIVTLGLYEFLVRPYSPVRFLFGMKGKKTS